MNEPKKRRFNIVDIIVLIILLLAAAFFAVKVLKPDAAKNISSVLPTPSHPVGTAHFVLEVDGIRKEMYDALAAEIPCPMMANGKLTDGRILSVRCEECTVAYLNVSNPINECSDRLVIPDENAEFVNAFFVCDAPLDMSNYNHYSVTQDIRIGRQYYLKTPMMELAGTVIELTVDGEPEGEPEGEPAE